jgi:hypothetical protein
LLHSPFANLYYGIAPLGLGFQARGTGRLQPERL